MLRTALVGIHNTCRNPIPHPIKNGSVSIIFFFTKVSHPYFIYQRFVVTTCTFVLLSMVSFISLLFMCVFLSFIECIAWQLTAISCGKKTGKWFQRALWKPYATHFLMREVNIHILGRAFLWCGKIWGECGKGGRLLFFDSTASHLRQVYGLFTEKLVSLRAQNLAFLIIWNTCAVVSISSESRLTRTVERSLAISTSGVVLATIVGIFGALVHVWNNSAVVFSIATKKENYDGEVSRMWL